MADASALHQRVTEITYIYSLSIILLYGMFSQRASRSFSLKVVVVVVVVDVIVVAATAASAASSSSLETLCEKCLYSVL